VESLCHQYADVIAVRGQKLSHELSSEPLLGYIDEQYYRMSLENILDNASKYTKDGGSIEISTDISGNFIHDDIKDYGVGIPPEDMSRLFEKFHRISNDMSHRVSGSGLGLYWVDKIIELHSGTIEVDSKLDRGTTFHVYVPICVNHA